MPRNIILLDEQNIHENFIWKLIKNMDGGIV